MPAGRPCDPRSFLGLANALNVSRQRFVKMIEEGKVPPRPEGKTWNVEEYLATCRHLIGENTRPALSRAARKQQKNPVYLDGPDTRGELIAPAVGTLAEATRLLEWEKYREKRIKVDQEEGKLVEISAVNAFVAGMIIRARDELTRIGPEIRERLAQENDPIKCESMVSDRIFQVLEKLTEYRPELTA
jgi:hypothetical protein